MKTALKLTFTITLIALSNLLTLPATAASNGNSNTAKKPGGPTATRLVDSLAGGSGSTIGPGGALFVTEGPTGSSALSASDRRGHAHRVCGDVARPTCNDAFSPRSGRRPCLPGLKCRQARRLPLRGPVFGGTG